MCGVHRWEEGGQEYKCYHDDLSADQQRRKKWLQKDSAPYNALKAIVLDKLLLRDMAHMTLFKHTGELEPVHHHTQCPEVAQRNIEQGFSFFFLFFLLKVARYITLSFPAPLYYTVFLITLRKYAYPPELQTTCH